MAKETKAEWLQKEITEAVRSSQESSIESVDFSDPNRPLTCLEVDFPIIPVNKLAAIETASGAAKKPIYQMSKWWARRPSSVFRSMLIAATIKAPEDRAEASKKVWENYYSDFSKNDFVKGTKVADVFMGGGTTLVEGSCLGYDMSGNDINPIAWLIVKNELSKVDFNEVRDLLGNIEEEVKPKVMPHYACKCPRGCKGEWKNRSTGAVMSDDFKIFNVPYEDRNNYTYSGPEITYIFWAKHGPCSTSGCGHRTPIIGSPIMVEKSVTSKYWLRKCSHCGDDYHLENKDVRLAPGYSLVIAESEAPFTTVRTETHHDEGDCPNCGNTEKIDSTWRERNKAKTKKVQLSLMVHPKWMKGEGAESAGVNFGGSANDDTDSTIAWNEIRAGNTDLIELRGKVPDVITCPNTGEKIETGSGGGTVSGVGRFACGACGADQKIVEAIARYGDTAPNAIYAIQGYCKECDDRKEINGGRFYFTPNQIDEGAAYRDWDKEKNSSLNGYWPNSEIPFGHMTHQRQPLPQHGYTHWWKMFNPRQLLVHAEILKSIATSSSSDGAKQYVLGGFMLYLRQNNMFSIWHKKNNQISAFFSNANFQPKQNTLEPAVFNPVGDGSWRSAIKSLYDSDEWQSNPWELVSNDHLGTIASHLGSNLSGKSTKLFTRNAFFQSKNTISCGSSTDSNLYQDESMDLVITDPPFGGLVHYSELADFFYVWVRLVLKQKYPDIFGNEYCPKSLEAVANKARQPGKDKETDRENSDLFYQRLLTECWRQSFRMLKPSGILAFTFHHSEDDPWVAVLESLFDAGFFLEATYPIRSDETKGDGQYGSKKIEYDIIHVCRKHLEETKPISWARLRRQVLQDVRRLQDLLEHHQMNGLPEADIQVIRRGKALEYFSKHYGKVYKSEGEVMSVQEALVGVNQLLEEETGEARTVPPHEAESFTRMLLRLFDSKIELDRDQIQKFLRGSGASPGDFLSRGWCTEKKKVFSLRPMPEMAKELSEKNIQRVTCDYEQAALLIGACFEDSGINVTKILNDKNFKPHPALKSVLEWFWDHGADDYVRSSARKASDIYSGWLQKHKPEETANLFDFFGES